METTAALNNDSDTKKYQKVVPDEERMDLEMGDADAAPSPKNKGTASSLTTLKLLIILVLIGWVIAVMFIVLYAVEVGNKDTADNINCDGQSQITSNSSSTSTTTTTTTLRPTSKPSTTTLPPTANPSTTSIPKNLIVLVSDGMGQSYNHAFRTYKNLTRTILDDHLKGRYSTTPTNPNGVTDSAAGATVFSTGFQSQNAFIGVDGYGNPKGTVLEAAKRKGKGTGLIATKSVTDATPAAFSSHSLHRKFNKLISKQQTTRQWDGKPMLDLLFGGGRKHFEGWGFFDNSTMHSEYGWSKVSQDSADFLSNLDTPDVNDLPYMFLPAEDSFPYHLDRLNGYVKSTDVGPYPTLNDMAKKAINLLSTKYETEGFFLMVEASEVDLCGHDNDIVCLLWEMEEFVSTTQYVIDWAKNNGETLVVMLSDHETGGMTTGRDASYRRSAVAHHFSGKTVIDDDIAGAWGSYAYDYSIVEPASLSAEVTNMALKKWFPTAVAGAKHTSSWFEAKLGAGNFSSVSEFWSALESDYLGSVDPILTDKEKAFMNETYHRDIRTRFQIAELMSARTLTGWTTRQHTGLDVAVHAYGPSEDLFRGHWTNYQIGQLLAKALDVENEQRIETEYLTQLFLDRTLQICDATEKLSEADIYIEWNSSVAYPVGNLLYPDHKCVDKWV